MRMTAIVPCSATHSKQSFKPPTFSSPVRSITESRGVANKVQRARSSNPLLAPLSEDQRSNIQGTKTDWRVQTATDPLKDDPKTKRSRVREFLT